MTENQSVAKQVVGKGARHQKLIHCHGNHEKITNFLSNDDKKEMDLRHDLHIHYIMVVKDMWHGGWNSCSIELC